MIRLHTQIIHVFTGGTDTGKLRVVLRGLCVYRPQGLNCFLSWYPWFDYIPIVSNWSLKEGKRRETGEKWSDVISSTFISTQENEKQRCIELEGSNWLSWCLRYRC
jgi:hypothetical protein